MTPRKSISGTGDRRGGAGVDMAARIGTLRASLQNDSVLDTCDRIRGDQRKPPCSHLLGSTAKSHRVAGLG